MCGFVAWLDFHAGVDRDRLLAARETVAHRGPDDAGLAILSGGRVGLAFRRLSILDLSRAGHQPMLDEAAGLGIVFNGEIYNFRELRQELAGLGHRFISDSDTEVLLTAFRQWGEKCLSRLVGMFAFAIWNERTQELFAARDRLGIKPLYYRASSGSLMLGSELRSIRCLMDTPIALSAAALMQYFERGYVAAPRTVLDGVASLPPGHALLWSPARADSRVWRYWRAEDFASRDRLDVTAARAEETVAELLTASVQSRLVSDVPLGAFLSGGIDSSLVVAIMRQVAGPDLRTFTIGFDDPRTDESAAAAEVARHLDTRHTVLKVATDDVLAAVRHLPRVFDEPFADSSQLPTWVLSRLTREHVTVALSGDGGDELFCGYRTYASLQRRAWVLKTPYALRRLGGRVGSGRLFPERIAQALQARGPVEFADALWNVVSHSQARSLLGITAPPELQPVSASAAANAVEALMLSDLLRYLPGDLLTKVDRTSMSCGLEVRVPMLDHRFVEYVLQLPSALRCDPGRPKGILRTLLARYVPPALTERPKQGFSVPLASWLSRELRPMREEYLGAEALRSQDVLDPVVVEACVRKFDEHGTGANLVWALLVLRQWLEHNGLARGVSVV